MLVAAPLWQIALLLTAPPRCGIFVAAADPQLPLKENPLERNQGSPCYADCGVFCTLYEAWVASLWWRNEFTTSGNYLMLKG